MTDQELSLKDYVEGRFDRMSLDIDQKIKAQHDSLVALMAASDRRFERAISDVIALVGSNDLRYQQRFEAQGKELDKAFSAAKGAVDAALAAADKAASKAEGAADKRFADLGELLREQFHSAGEKVEAFSIRIGLLENSRERVTGNREGMSASGEFALKAASFVSTLLAIAAIVYAVLKP